LKYIEFAVIGIFFAFPPIFANSNWVPYTPSAYPDSQYITSKKEIRQDVFTVNVIGVQEKKEKIEKSRFTYRGWIEVFKNSESIFKKYYADIDAVGSEFGLYVPSIQPSQPIIAIIKKGDYDGRLFLVTKKGTIIDTIGGNYFISSDNRLLFSQYYSDISGVSVIDLNQSKVLFSSSSMPYIFQWYIFNNTYFFTEWAPQGGSSGYLPIENKNFGYFFDLNLKKFIKKSINSNIFKNSKKVEYDSDKK